MEQVKKRCVVCHRMKNIGRFYAHKFTKDGVQSLCKLCVARRGAKYYKERHKAGRIEWQKRLWLDAINKLGKFCVRCGENDISMLEIDHIFNDGRKQRKEMHAYDIYRWAIESPDAPSRLQTLCRNCNRLKVINPAKYAEFCPDRLSMASCP